MPWRPNAFVRRLLAVGDFLRRLLIASLVFLVRLYQIFISPVTPKSCRFKPTCSQYCVLALKKYGVIVGLYKTFRRLMRCHPFNDGGYDPP
ncbi:MAG: membrane protein insertion efficiency factor YidD [Planctomycetia bacterium]|nr:membrane protein insertion efficiency factor YidD [Planctomycetia bacterium]